MVKSQKEETISALTTRIFSAMLDDLSMDVVLQSHHEIARSRSICTVCKTRCSSVHTPSQSQIVAQPPTPSRPSTPSDAKVANGTVGTGTSTPTSIKADGNLYLECVNCSRQIASNRYAPHLSSCMGLATTRRGAARGNAAKSKPSSEAGGRSTSPEASLSDDGATAKGKGKSKTKRVDEADFNLKRKRVSRASTRPFLEPTIHTAWISSTDTQQETEEKKCFWVAGLTCARRPWQCMACFSIFVHEIKCVFLNRHITLRQRSLQNSETPHWWRDPPHLLLAIPLFP
ncbi:hypothetical protein B0H10DRAFT_1995646 [Mycena sp. CBHHK59/15]|nr:hypothetical protein B0H10DRAFT_1995646 [Mycena sp. CBHHK59/15]